MDDGEERALSARQRAVLALASAGHSNAEIGAALGIRPDTVAAHLAAAYAALGLPRRDSRHTGNRVVACVWFATHGTSARHGGEG